MKILILGGGQVGATLAEHLANEAFDITVVDHDEERLAELRDRLDIQTVAGWASHPDVLRRGGVEDADLLIAVTGSDEVNMVACQVAYTHFRTPRKIARVRAAAYLNRDDLFDKDHVPIDVLINPEQVVTEQIRRLLEHPGALQVLDFVKGRVQLVAVRAYAGSPLVGQELRLVRQQLPAGTRVAAIFRQGSPILPTGGTAIEADDEVFFIAAAEHINAVMGEITRVERAFKRVMIAGGGQIGERLAHAIEPYFSVKLIEYDRARCEQLAESLSDTVVLQGDATDQDLLLEENIEQVDAFCAVTNDDEVNIMSSLMAKRLGVRQVMSLISKPAYVDLMQGGDIDIAISPQHATTSEVLSYVRRADVARVHTLRRGAAEAIEAVAHGDAKNSKVVGKYVKQIDLPPGTTIGAIVRGDEVLVTHSEVVVQPEDHIILFLTDKKYIPQVERLFQVGLSFF